MRGDLPRMRPLLLKVVVKLALLAACGDSDGSGAGTSGGGDANGGSNTGGCGTEGCGGDPSNGAGDQGGSTTTGPLVGCAASFDGADDVMIGDVSGEGWTGDNFSIGGTFDPDTLAAGARGFLVGRHLDGNNNGFYLAVANERGAEEVLFIVFTPASTCVATAPLPSGGPVHILGSYASPDARIFIDGNQAGSADCPDQPSNIEPDSVLTIGRSQTGVFPYAGLADDILYLPSAVTTAFDPSSLGCDNAELVYTFDGVAPGETGSVPEACSGAPALTVGDEPGADDSDPAILCAR